MPRISHFDIPADDPKRAQKFYQDVFGWKFDKWDGPMEYWMVKTGDDKAARNQRRSKPKDARTVWHDKHN